MKDGEVMVDYLRNSMNIKKLGVHGVSLGGFIATYLANSRQLDFLVADRAFSSLVNVVKYGFHGVVSWIFLFITWWNYTSSGDLIDTKCYKVTTFDSKDDVIPSLGSLAFGVTSEVLRRKFLHDHDMLFGDTATNGETSSRGLLVTKSNSFLLKKYPFLHQIAEKVPYFNTWIVNWVINMEASNYNENYYLNILSTNDYNILFFALKRIFNVIIDSSKLKTGTNNKHADDESPEAAEAKAAEKHNQNVSFYKQEMSILNANENVLEELEEEEPEGSKTPLKEIKMLASMEEEYRVSLENDSEHDVHNFVLSVFSLMELIDSAGVTLDVIFGSNTRNQDELLKVN